MEKTPIRRIVTCHDSDGRAAIASDGPPQRIYDNLGQEGLVFYEVWHTTESPAKIERKGDEVQEPALTLAPPANGTRIRILDIPPDNVKSDFEKVFTSIGGDDAHQVAADAPHPAMHRTRSIDYGIVLEGEITLILDTTETVVRQGEVVVQRGTNHAWANRSGKNCRMAFVLIDGQFGTDLM